MTLSQYTAREVFQTAERYMDSQHGLGAGLTHGINQVCRCCKAGSLVNGQPQGQVDKIINPVDLKPWTDFYLTHTFAAYQCQACGYQWSWYRA